MDAHSTNILAWAVVISLFLLGLQISKFLIRRAVLQVISILRKTYSRCSESPKTVHELGLEQPDFFERMLKPRDYKPYALQALIAAGIVQMDGANGKVCLLENNVPESLKNA